jgi:hypothetical protein
MFNWQTTLGGIITAVGSQLEKQPGWLGLLGQGLMMLGPLVLGAAAADAAKVVPKQ